VQTGARTSRVFVLPGRHLPPSTSRLPCRARGEWPLQSAEVFGAEKPQDLLPGEMKERIGKYQKTKINLKRPGRRALEKRALPLNRSRSLASLFPGTSPPLYGDELLLKSTTRPYAVSTARLEEGATRADPPNSPRLDPRQRVSLGSPAVVANRPEKRLQDWWRPTPARISANQPAACDRPPSWRHDPAIAAGRPS